MGTLTRLHFWTCLWFRLWSPAALGFKASSTQGFCSRLLSWVQSSQELSSSQSPGSDFLLPVLAVAKVELWFYLKLFATCGDIMFPPLFFLSKMFLPQSICLPTCPIGCLTAPMCSHCLYWNATILYIQQIYGFGLLLVLITDVSQAIRAKPYPWRKNNWWNVLSSFPDMTVFN